jgi:hypothetical protein
MSLCLDEYQNNSSSAHILAVDQVGALKAANKVSQRAGDKYLQSLAVWIANSIYEVIPGIRTYMYQQGGTTFVHLPPGVTGSQRRAILSGLKIGLPVEFNHNSGTIRLITTCSIHSWSGTGETLGIQDMDTLRSMFSQVHDQANRQHFLDLVFQMTRVLPSEYELIQYLGKLFNPYDSNRGVQRLTMLGVDPEIIKGLYRGKGSSIVSFGPMPPSFAENASLPSDHNQKGIVDYRLQIYSLIEESYEEFLRVMQKYSNDYISRLICEALA